jgi:hypothetical protein
MSSSSSENKFDPKRKLCPDGSCLGLIGADGRCNVCGLGASGRVEAASAPEAWDDSSADVGFEHEHEHEHEREPELAAAGGFDPKRKLCPDGSCLGVIEASGRCSVCGQAG